MSWRSWYAWVFKYSFILHITHNLIELNLNSAAAYFGFKLLAANPREILILNSAAGTVGSIVGQLAKIKVFKTLVLIPSSNY